MIKLRPETMHKIKHLGVPTGSNVYLHEDGSGEDWDFVVPEDVYHDIFCYAVGRYEPGECGYKFKSIKAEFDGRCINVIGVPKDQVRGWAKATSCCKLLCEAYPELKKPFMKKACRVAVFEALKSAFTEEPDA